MPAGNLRLQSSTELSARVHNSIRTFFSGIPAQLVSRQHVPAARPLRGLSFRMRVGCAPQRAECAPTTHFGAHHGRFLWIICANWHFLRATRFFPGAQRRDIAARARQLPELSKIPPERPVMPIHRWSPLRRFSYYIYYYVIVQISMQKNRNKFPESCAPRPDPARGCRLMQGIGHSRAIFF